MDHSSYASFLDTRKVGINIHTVKLNQTTSKTLLRQHFGNIQIKGNGIELPRVARHLPGHPLESVSPIDEIQVANTHQRPLVPLITSPLTTSHAYQTIIGTLCLSQDSVR